MAFVAVRGLTVTGALATGFQQPVIALGAADREAGSEEAAQAFRAVTAMVGVEDVSVVHMPAPVAITTFNYLIIRFFND